MNAADERTIDVWFKAMEKVLFCLPPAGRLEVLHKLAAREIERRENEREDGPLRVTSFADFDPATLKNWHAVKEAESLIIQVLVRSITNNYSPSDAAKVLFREHRRGTGSRWLPDYLDGLPGITVDLKRCHAISASNGASELTHDPSNHISSGAETALMRSFDGEAPDSSSEHWPDIHDHISQLENAGVIPSDEDDWA